jgi:putative peptidoglycan lipid II flippase
MPNVLQNLLGEGTLSASFIPVYSELLGRGRTAEAGRVAGAMFALLLAVAGAIALTGIALAPALVSLFTPGFTGERRELTIAIVRIIFPMTGLLVLSAWALAILNSHRRFFLPYFAPVLWNASIIGALFAFGGRVELDALLSAAAWGALLGGLLQFLVQVPLVLKLTREIKLTTGRSEPGFREVLRNAGPAILGRGVVQLSGYVDMVLASLLAIGAVASLRYAQTLYILPISLFAMSIAAAELPELSRERGAGAQALRERVVAAGRRSMLFVVPSLVAFLALGEILVAGLYQSGQFGAGEVRLVWLVLAAYALGLLASTSTRIYQSAFSALRDTRTPARVAGLRVPIAAVAGAVLMAQFESVTLGRWTTPTGLFADARVTGMTLGPVGLALGASVGAWLEWLLLRRALARSIGAPHVGASVLARMVFSALLAAAAALGLAQLVPTLHPLPRAMLCAGVFGAIYFAVAALSGVAGAREVMGSIARRIRSR